MKEKKKIAAAGHICLDITPVFPGKTEGTMAEILKPGRLLHMDGVDVHTGGSAANTGLALKLMGADVRILGKVGEDTFGRIVGTILEQHGVRHGLIRDEQGSTSYSVILAIPGTDRIFLHNSGANDTYGPEDISEEALEGLDLFHFGYPPLMRRMYENEGRELEEIFRKVKAKGIPVSLDMAAVDAASPAGSAHWEKILRRVLPLVDVFLPSVEELLFMADQQAYRKIVRIADGRDVTEVADIRQDVMPLAEKMLEWGAKNVLIKCGSKGLYFASAGLEKQKELQLSMGLDAQAWAGKRLFEAGFRPEKICSGTGAGDTCIAAFLMGMLLGKTPEKSVRLAAAQGACCVEAYDALGGLRTLEELEKRIEGGWEKSK